MSTRNITTHHVNDCNRSIELVASESGAGAAPIRYDVFGPRKQCGGAGPVPSFGLNIKFQDGPIANGVNGVTNEVLLAIVEDRLAAFQTGPFACDENEAAIAAIRQAQHALQTRTRARQDRGVEGTHEV